MDQDGFNLLALLLPHKLTLEIYRLRNDLWRYGAGLSYCLLPPCIPLFTTPPDRGIPSDICWTKVSLQVANTPLDIVLDEPSRPATANQLQIEHSAMLLPLVPSAPIKHLRTALYKALQQEHQYEPSYFDKLLGIDDINAETGIFLGQTNPDSKAYLRQNQLSLSPFDDARLAMFHCRLKEPASLESGGRWTILEQKHLIPQ